MTSFSLYDSTANPLYPNTTTAATMDNLNCQYVEFNQNLPSTNLAAPVRHELSLNKQDSDGKTQLHRAVINKLADRVQNLLGAGAAVDIKDGAGNEALHYGITAHEPHIVNLLLKFGADVNAIGQLGRSPLHLAVLNLEIVDTLLHGGAIVSSQDDKGDTPLHLALSNRNAYSHYDWSIVDTLVRAGSDVNLANNAGVTPFHKILDLEYDSNCEYIYKYLTMFLDSGASVAQSAPNHRLPFRTLLTRSGGTWWVTGSPTDGSETPNENTVFKYFLRKGADPATQLTSGEFLWENFFRSHFLQWKMDPEVAELLCRNANPGQATANGNSILHELSLKCRTTESQDTTRVLDLMAILLKNGADPNQRNQKGETPLLLIFIEEENSEKLVMKAMSILLGCGADPMLRDISNNCPLYQAVRFLNKAVRFLPIALKHMLQADLELGEATRLSRERISDTMSKRFGITGSLLSGRKIGG